MNPRACLYALLAFALCPAVRAAERGDQLYSMTLLQAAPGRQLELIGAVKAARAGAPPKALVLRHSQGDRWDLMLLSPLAAPEQFRARAVPEAADELVAWQEDELVRGPDLASLEGFLEAGLYHVEMFHALAGRREGLVRQREMENAYLRGLGRPRNAIFTRERGASWDAFTIGAYKSWSHYAARDEVPQEKAEAAARAAGFESEGHIGPYLRSLIQDHHDTLATPLR